MSRLDQLSNATDRDRSATLIEISENRGHQLKPDQKTRYIVTLQETGEVLLDMATDPECEAARILRGRGATGRLITCYAGSNIIAMRMDSNWAAERYTSETRAEGPKTRKYVPMTDRALAARMRDGK